MKSPGIKGIIALVGIIGNSHDDALAETIIRLFKAELIHLHNPWKGYDVTEYSKVGGRDGQIRFNNRRPLKPMGNISPLVGEKEYYQPEKSNEAA